MGGFSLVRCLDAVMRYARLSDDAERLAEGYAVFRVTAQRALDEVTD
jgi:hypothetical protein